MNENVLLGCFYVFWRGLRHDFDLFWPISVKRLVHLGAFDGFRSTWVLGWSVMFGCLTVFNHWVFQRVWWVLGCMLPCIGVDWLPVRYSLGARFQVSVYRVVACTVCFRLLVWRQQTRRLEYLTAWLTHMLDNRLAPMLIGVWQLLGKRKICTGGQFLVRQHGWLSFSMRHLRLTHIYRAFRLRFGANQTRRLEHLTAWLRQQLCRWLAPMLIGVW